MIWEVRKAFRRHLALSSLRYIKDALSTGYNAHKLILSAANGSPAATSQINDLLRLQEQKRAISKAQPRPIQEERPRVWPYVEGEKVLELRPRAQGELGGSGKRKIPIPVIVATCGLPFLRFQKPQSPYLTRIINDKAAGSKKRGQMLLRMQGEEEFGEAENRWDSLLNKARGVPEFQTTEHPIEAISDGVSWAGAPREVLRHIQEKRDKTINNEARRGDQMMRLIEKETQLRDAERIENRRNKKRLKSMGSATSKNKQFCPEETNLTVRIDRHETKKEPSVPYKPLGSKI